MKTKVKHSPSKRAYAGQTAVERTQAQRQRLLDAALAHYGSRDAGTPPAIDRLCASARIGIRVYYKEFGSHDALFRGLYDHLIEDVMLAVERALERTKSAPLVDQLTQTIKAYLDSLLRDPRRGRVISVTSAHFEHTLGTHRNDTLLRFARLAQRSAPTHLTPVQRKTWSLLLAGGVNETLISLLRSRAKPSTGRAAVTLGQMLARAAGEPS